MGGDYFCDVLDCSDKRMDYDSCDQFKQDPLKTLSFKVKSAPSKALTMANGMDMVRGKTAGEWDFKHKTELKHACANNQYESKVVASNKDFTFEVEAKPEKWNQGLDTKFDFETKCTPQKGDWEAKLAAKVGGFQVGPLVPFTEVS
jgi:hypothetical protein